MSFKPQASGTQRTESNIDWEIINAQITDQLEEGLIVGVVSGIVDLGVQERDAIKQEDGTYKERKPAQEVALFIDIPEVQIDWDAAAKNKDAEDFKAIGIQPYRLMVNPEFKGDVRGITFAPAPPMDKDGNILEVDGAWTFAATSVLTKIAKAADVKEVIDGNSESNMDISLLLGKPLMVNIEIKEGKNGAIFPKIASYAKAKPKDLKGVDLDCVNTFMVDFEDPKAEDLNQLRISVKNKIARSTQFEGSVIQKVLKETGYEPRQKNNTTEKPNTSDTPPDTKATKGSESKAKPEDDYDDDVPF